MNKSSSEFPEFDRIVDEVLKGERVFAIWPGTLTVVAIIMFHLLAAASWLGPTFFAAVPWLKSNLDPWQPLLLVALALCTLAIVIPALLTVRGEDRGYSLLRALTRCWFGGAALTAFAAELDWLKAPLWPYGVSCAALAVAYVLERSEGAAIYVMLRKRLRVRQIERAQERKS